MGVTTIARGAWVGWCLAIAALGVTPAGAQFSHAPSVEKNFTAGIGTQLSAHDHRAMAFGSGSNVVTLLTLDNRLLRATTSYNYGDVFPEPSAVAGAPNGAFGVKAFDAKRGAGSTLYLAYVSEDNPGISVRARTSTDLGATWGPETVISGGTSPSAPSSADVKVAASGNVAAVLYIGSDVYGYGYDPYVSVSTDAGQTWNPPVRVDAGVPARRYETYDASLTVTPSGVVCVAFVQDRTDDPYDDSDVYVTRSTDGFTFSAETAILPANHVYSANVDLVVANDGGVLLAFWDSQLPPPFMSYEERVLVYRSTNGGASYAAGTNVLLPTTSTRLAPHLAVAGSPGTTVLMGYVDGSNNVRMHRSTNNGASFGAAATLATTAAPSTRLPILHTPAGWALGWSDARSDTYDGTKTDVYMRSSTDDGVTWKPEALAGVGPYESRIESLTDAGDQGTGRRVYMSYLDAAASAGAALDLRGARLSVAAGTYDFDRADTNDVESARPRTETGAVLAVGGSTVVEAFAAAVNSAFTDIYAAVSSDGGYNFGAPVRVGSNPAGARIEGDPRVAIGGGGLYLVYSSDNPGVGREIRFTRSADGVSWTPDVVLGTVSGFPAGALENTYPQAKLVASGARVWVTWSSGADVYLARSSDGGVSFTVTDVDQDSRGYNEDPALCVAGNRVVLAYMSPNSGGSLWSVWGTVSEDNGATWSTRTQLRPDTATNQAWAPIVICHDTAPPVALYLDERPGPAYALRSSTYQLPGGWSADAAVTIPAGATVQAFDAAYAANGNALVVYPDAMTGRMWRTAAFTPGSFTDLAALDDRAPKPSAMSYAPRIATSGNDVFVGWLDNSAGWSSMVVFYMGADLDPTGRGVRSMESTYFDGAFMSTLTLFPSGRAMVAENGRAHVAWTSQRTSAFQEALYNVWDFNDNDRDGVSSAIDCQDFDPGVFAAPVEVAGLTVGRSPTSTSISWSSQAGTAGTATRYDLVRGPLGALRGTGGFSAAGCLANDWLSNTFVDNDPDPAAGDGVYYLTRAVNSCGTGTYGNSSLVSDPRDSLDAGAPCP